MADKKQYIVPCQSCGKPRHYVSYDGYWKGKHTRPTCHKCGNRCRPYEWIYNKMVADNKRRRHKEIQLTYEEFLEFVSVHNCHYCEKEVVWSPYTNSKFQGYNLDRKDNELGYTKENCVVCCYHCNTTKGEHFSYDEMMMLKPTLMLIQQIRKAG